MNLMMEENSIVYIGFDDAKEYRVVVGGVLPIGNVIRNCNRCCSRNVIRHKFENNRDI